MNNEYQTTAANVNAGDTLITATHGRTKVLSANFVRAAVPAHSQMIFTLEGVKGEQTFAAYSLVSVERK